MTRLTITENELMALDPCDWERRKAWFRGRNLGVEEALAEGATIRDVLWVAGKLERKDLCVKFALLCAKRVVNLNNNSHVLTALIATENWFNDQTEKNRIDADYAAEVADFAYVSASSVKAAYSASSASSSAEAAASSSAAEASRAASRAATYAVRAATHSAANFAVGEAAEVEAQKKILINIFNGE